jgi:signal transduction histidine kinase
MGPDTVMRLRSTAALVVLYLVARTLLAALGPSKLRWELIFPPFDVVAASALIWAAGREPISNLSTLYLLAVVEVSESQDVRWIAAVSAMISGCEAVATWGHHLQGLFGVTYPYIFLFGAGMVSGLLARAAIRNREQLAVAQDRERIAFEMHDGVQGHLVTIASQLELVGHLAGSDPKTATQISWEARDLARLAADELRYLVHRLRSPSIQGGFGASLTQFAYQVTQRSELDLNVDIKDELSLTPETEHALFRIAQEAINNSIRHAQANKIEISLSESDLSLELKVVDDGIGFEAGSERADAAMHSGLDGMSARAAKLGGTLAIQSALGQGTSVTVRVPAT